VHSLLVGRNGNLKYPFTKYLKWKNNKYLSHFREIGGIQHQTISTQNDVDFPPISLKFDKYLLVFHFKWG
jgi:hypothetical protein